MDCNLANRENSELKSRLLACQRQLREAKAPQHTAAVVRPFPEELARPVVAGGSGGLGALTATVSAFERASKSHVANIQSRRKNSPPIPPPPEPSARRRATEDAWEDSLFNALPYAAGIAMAAPAPAPEPPAPSPPPAIESGGGGDFSGGGATGEY